MDETNVLIFTFPDPSKAYQALSEIKAQPGVQGAAVVGADRQWRGSHRRGLCPEAGGGPAVRRPDPDRPPSAVVRGRRPASTAAAGYVSIGVSVRLPQSTHDP